MNLHQFLDYFKRVQSPKEAKIKFLVDGEVTVLSTVTYDIGHSVWIVDLRSGASHD